MYTRRPLLMLEGVGLQLQSSLPSSPADSHQLLLRYLAIPHPADCNLPVLHCYLALLYLLGGGGLRCHRAWNPNEINEHLIKLMKIESLASIGNRQHAIGTAWHRLGQQSGPDG